MSVVPAGFERIAIRSGSPGRQQLLARFFIDTLREYDPHRIDGPSHPSGALACSMGVPSWQVTAAVALNSDPLPQQALSRVKTARA